jgi:cardiolipin synthase
LAKTKNGKPEQVPLAVAPKDDAAAESEAAESEAMERLVLHASERKPAVIQLIASAQREVAISVFRCDDFGILDELAAAVDRNVRVRALITPAAKNWERRLRDLESFLQSMGAEVRRYAGARSKYHAKYVVADESRALVASLNFTRKCFDETCDFLVLTREPDVVSSLLRLFEADSNNPDGGLPQNLSPDLIIGPELVRSRYLDLLGQAQRSIRIIDHRLSDPQMFAALRQRQAAGVAVQLLGYGSLEGMVSHGRMMLIDETTAIIGSTALTPASLDERREVGLVLRDPANAARLKHFFDNLVRRRPENITRLAEFADAEMFGNEDDEE